MSTSKREVEEKNLQSREESQMPRLSNAGKSQYKYIQIIPRHIVVKLQNIKDNYLKNNQKETWTWK